MKEKKAHTGSNQRSAKTTRVGQEFAPTLGALDLHLFGEGKHDRVYEKLGAHVMTHEGRRGVAFAVVSPSANQVSVVCDFNGWNGANHQMRCLDNSGVWELFIPGLKAGELYKYEVRHGRRKFLKADPYAFMMEVPPDTSSIVFKSRYKFRDRAWITKRKKRQAWREPLAIYEVHLGSWRRIPEENNRSLGYREIAPLLADYVIANGFPMFWFKP